jgi:hypothetical protein
MTRPTDDRDRLADTVFGDRGPIDRDALEPNARRELEQLEALDRLLAGRGRREPPPSRRAHLWTRIAARLDEPAAHRAPRRLVWAAAAAAVVALAIALAALGPVAPTGPGPVAVTATPPADDSLDRLLARSEPLLMGLANRPADGPLESERKLAASLAADSRTVADRLDPRRRDRERELAAELEAVMLQIANADRPEDLELVRATIEERRILLAIALRGIRRAALDVDPDRRKDPSHA